MRDGNGSKAKKQLVKELDPLPLRKEKVKGLEAERKQADEALQAEMNKLQSVMDSVEDGLTMQDKDYNILYQNGPLRKNYGDCVGEKCYRLYEGRDKVCEGCPTKKAFNDGKSHTAERKVVLPSGEEAFGEVTASPIRDAKGKIISCLEIIRNITEHKQVDEALQAEKNKLQSVIGAMEYTLTIQDKDYNIIYQNEPSKLASDGDHLGEKCYRVYEGNKEVCDGCPMKKAFKDGKSHTAERRRIEPSGEVTFWENTANPIRDAKGKIISCLEVARNITERKNTEEALRESEEKFRGLAERSPNMIFINRRGGIVYANEKCEEVMGYKREEFYAPDFNFLNLIAPESVELIKTNFSKHMKGEDLAPYEYTLITKDGNRIEAIVTTALIKYEGERAVLGAITDITKRKQAEDALQIEKNKLQSVVDALEYGITIQDRDYNIIYQNEQAKKPFGEHIGEKCYRAYSGNEQVCDGCPVAKAFKDGKSHTDVRPNISPSGEVTYWENTASPIRGADGKIVSCLEITRNITERKQAEEALVDEATQRRILIDQSLDGIVILDENSKVVEANQRFAEMLGYTPEEVRELHTWDWDKNFPPEKLLEMGRNVDETGLHLETKHHRKDGTTIDVEISINGAVCAGRKLIFCVCRDITERKQAEEALQAEKNKLQSVIGAMEDGLTIQDRDYNIVYQNEPARVAFGDHVGEKCYRAYEGREKLCDGCPLEKAFKDGKSHTAERKAVTPSGEVAFWETTANPIRDAEGKIVSCIEIGRDITERKQAEEKLQLLSSVTQQVSDVTIVTDLGFNIKYVNKAAQDLFGYSAEEMLGKRMGDFNAEPLPKKLEQEIVQTLASGKLWVGTLGKRRKDGSTFLGECHISPLYDKQGQISSYIDALQDITERKQAEDALRESEGRYRAVVEGTHDMIQSVGLDGRIIFVNKSWLDTLGYTEAELSSLNLFDIIHPDSQAHCQKMFAKVASGKSLHGIEAAFLTKDGRKILVEGNAAPRYIGDKVVATQGVFRDITERKQAEEALADEVTRRRILIDQSRDGIVILDQNGKVYEANQRFAEMLGYTPEEVRELHAWDWDTQWTREQLLEMIKSVDAAGDYFETYHSRKDGTTIDVEISTNGAVYAGQKLVFCVCRDITERKQAEKTLLEAEEKYKNLVEAASDIIWEADEKGVYTFVSPRIKELLGYEVEEVVGKMRTLDFTPKKEVRKWFKRFKEVNAKRVSFSGFEVPHLHKNGTPVIIEVSGIPFVDSEGNFKGYVGVNKDVTERKQVTEALKESQEFSDGLLENSPNPIFVLNPDTSVRYVNPAFEKLTGFTLAEIAGKKAPYPWWPEDEREEMTLALKNTMVQGGKRSEKDFHKKDGERFWVALNSAPVMHRGKLLYFLINWLDITERKRAEEEKLGLEQKAHLASRLASVGEMASGIAHEINNPLTAVIGFAQLLMDADLPDDLKEDLVIIHKEAQRAAGVARNLLTFARKHAPVQQSTNVNSIIEGVLTLRAYEQNVSNIQINTKFAPDLPEVKADYSQLQQVFINLILNAEAAMLEAGNGGMLTITTQKVNHSIRASFADDGPGITKENLDRIFDPFFTTKEVGKGTGLGLSVCHGIIAEHGGKIYARSKPGSGATFVVELPINAHERLEEPNETA